MQFNLLPDVKLNYIRAAKTKRIVISVSVLVSALVIVIVTIIALSVFVLQKRYIANLSTDITQLSSELTGTEDIDRILTVQNQLAKLPALHEQKPAAGRIYTFLSQLTPANINLNKLNVVFAEKSLTIDGQGKTISDVNTFVDTLKFTKYKIGDADQEAAAFPTVVLGSVGLNETGKANFVVTIVFDETIFDNTQKITLQIPDIISSRSETQKPKNIFDDTSGGQ